LPLELLSGASGLERPIASPHIQNTGHALAGFDEYLQPGRVLVFGESEMRFLEGLDSAARRQALAAAFARDIPCVLVTGGLEPSVDLRDAADRHQVPLLRTKVPTPLAIAKLTTLLEDSLAVREVMHGVLMDILGLGVLIVGESGIGKSECALDLVVRGHRLVADDAVELRRRGEAAVIGTCPELTRHHMEVRGLGVINIRDLFGIASTRASKRVELVVQLERWDPPSRYGETTSPPRYGETSPPSRNETSAKVEATAGTGREYDRLGLDDRFYDLLGLKVPLVRMPVAAGRSLAILVEVAARNQILRARGRHAARELAARVERALAPPRAGVHGADAASEDHVAELEAECEDDAESGGDE
jgi:HPr kinase/phosphorylase